MSMQEFIITCVLLYAGSGALRDELVEDTVADLWLIGAWL